MTGLGPFKIGQTTTSELVKLCASANISLQSSYSLHASREAGDSTVAFIVPYESAEDYPDASSLSSPAPNVTVFYFPAYSVADIAIEGLTLKFYKGVLASISMEGFGDLPAAFELKYGKATLSTLTNSSTCLFRLTGNKTTYKDESFFQRWYNGDIVALYLVGASRDANCKKESYAVFRSKANQKQG